MPYLTEAEQDEWMEWDRRENRVSNAVIIACVAFIALVVIVASTWGLSDREVQQCPDGASVFVDSNGFTECR